MHTHIPNYHVTNLFFFNCNNCNISFVLYFEIAYYILAISKFPSFPWDNNDTKPPQYIANKRLKQGLKSKYDQAEWYKTKSDITKSILTP